MGVARVGWGWQKSGGVGATARWGGGGQQRGGGGAGGGGQQFELKQS